MDVRRVVFLVLENTVDHADVAAAVDIVRGIGRNAYHAPLAGRRNNHQPAEFDVAAALGNHAHAAAMVEVDVANHDAPAVGQRETGVVARRRAEHHHVAHRGFQVFAQDADIAVLALLGRNRPVRKPVIRGAEGGFPPHGVEFQQVGEGIDRSLRVAEAEAAVDDVAQVVLREADFQPAVARRLDNSLGVERTGEIDCQVANRNILALFEAERRNEAREEQLGAAAVDFEIAHARKIERDALEALVVVADELVLLDCLIGPHAEAAAGQDELPPHNVPVRPARRARRRFRLRRA